MDRQVHPARTVDDAAKAARLPRLTEQTPGLDPQWAPQARRDAEASFKEKDETSKVAAQETGRKAGTSAVHVVWRGLLAGLAGVAAMTVAEKIEQRFTQRPNSFIPAHTLERLLRLPHAADAERRWMNGTMHWGQGILLGAVRGAMAARGLRGPVGSFVFMNLRLANDQTLENATQVGAPPWTWPVDEQAIDLLHKAVYAFATGMVADRLIVGPPGVPARRRSWDER